MISFAANHEDVRLARVLTDTAGTYVDVGANHPVHGSVTKHFYDRGWRGLNIEPSPSLFAEIERQRPDDINVRAAAWNESGTGRFNFFPLAPGLSTMKSDVAANHALMLGEPELHDVPLVTLADLFAEHFPAQGVDLMVVDVEGAESTALAGADFTRWRPRIVVVEATKPLTREATHHEWEGVLVDADYIPTAFDGCNRFYVATEAAELAPPLAEPICYFDRYIDHEVVRVLHGLTAALNDRAPNEVFDLLERIAGANVGGVVEILDALGLRESASWMRRGA